MYQHAGSRQRLTVVFKDLNACIKEGPHMHPAVDNIFEPVVPTSDLTLPSGDVSPPGTIVGVNPWVIHYKDSRVSWNEAARIHAGAVAAG